MPVARGCGEVYFMVQVTRKYASLQSVLQSNRWQLGTFSVAPRDLLAWKCLQGND